MPTITEAKREIPVRKKVDVLVVGGSTAGVTTKNGYTSSRTSIHADFLLGIVGKL